MDRRGEGQHVDQRRHHHEQQVHRAAGEVDDRDARRGAENRRREDHQHESDVPQAPPRQEQGDDDRDARQHVPGAGTFAVQSNAFDRRTAHPQIVERQPCGLIGDTIDRTERGVSVGRALVIDHDDEGGGPSVRPDQRSAEPLDRDRTRQVHRLRRQVRKRLARRQDSLEEKLW